MMKTNELRIGNYVWEDYSGEMIVSMINDYDGAISLRKNITLPFGLYGIKDINPIPLTEQWLKDFVFKQDHNWFIKWGGELKFRMSVSDKYIWTGIYYDGYIEVSIKYVHQLQNLYFALTGKELTK